MTALHRGLPLAGIALLLTTTGALAQVTAQQVWDDWRTSIAASGQTTVSTGSENLAGGVLTVTDLAIDMTAEGGTTHAVVPEIVFTEQGDGSVAITMSPAQTLRIVSAGDEHGDSFDIGLILEQTDGVTTASGAPGAMTYAVAMPRVTLRLDHVIANGEPAEADGAVILSNLAGTFTWGMQGNLFDIDYRISADRADLKVSVNEPDGQGNLTASGTYAGMQSDVSMSYPSGIDSEDTEALFAAGFRIESNGQAGAAETSFSFVDGDSTAQGSLRFTGAGSHVSVSQDNFAYEMKLEGIGLDTTGSELPFPVSLSAGELGLRLAMPMTPTPEPAPFAGRISLADLEVSDGIWDMLDAARVIPRTPATVTVDLTGTAIMTRNILAEPGEDFGMSEAPGVLHSLDINTVDLAFGGATAHADGAFTFDPSDTTTFDGMPRPEGRISVALSGVNGLMQKLGQIGLLPPEQAMGVTMMLGMFAVPSGDDQMTSTIEVGPDGSVTANGMPLPF